MIDKYTDIKRNRYGTRLMILNIEINERRKGNSIVRVLDIDNNIELGEYTLKEFSHGDCISPFDRQFQGVGFLGVGNRNERNSRKEFIHYQDFINKKFYELSEELNRLLDFQEFCRFYDNNHYEPNLKDCSERGMGGKYNVFMKLAVIKANNKFNLCFVPSALSILLMSKSKDFITVKRSDIRADKVIVQLPRLNKSTARILDSDGDYFAKEDLAKEKWIERFTAYIRDLSIDIDSKDYIAELDNSIVDLLDNFEYFE